MIRIVLSRGEAGALLVIFVMLTGTVFVAGALSGYRAARTAGVDVPVRQANICPREDDGVQAAVAPRDSTPALASASPAVRHEQEPRRSLPGATASVPSVEPVPTLLPRHDAPAKVDPLFEIQVGAFANPANAEALAARLRRRGYDPVIVQARARSGDWLRLVRLPIRGPESTVAARARAFSAEERLPAIAVPVR